MYITYFSYNNTFAPTPESKFESCVVVLIPQDQMETCWKAANSTAQQMRQHSTLSMTLCDSRNTNWLLMPFLWQLVNIWRADVLRQASVDLRDEMKQFGRRLTCRGKRLRRGRLVPAALGKIWVVDGWMWTEISRMASALHTHTHTQPHTYTAKILVFRAELQLSSFSVYLFLFK